MKKNEFENIVETKLAKSRIKQKWGKNDVIIALLYSKFGFRKLGISDDDTELECFVNEYIGSNAASLKMESMNIRYLLCLKHNEEIDGLGHYSKLQEEVVHEYDSYDESQLSDLVNSILDNITEEQRKENLINIGIRTDVINQKREKKLNEKKLKKITEKRKAELLKKINTRYCITATVNKVDKYFISGDEIEHKSYGKGIITSIDGMKITIEFNDFGVKTLFFNESYFNL